MKKLVIATCAVALAAVVQAASINWAATGNYLDKNGNIATESTADAGTFVLVALGSGTADWSNPTVVNEGAVQYGSGKSGTYAKVGGSYTWTYGAEGTPQNGDIFAVMFRDGDGNLNKLGASSGEANEATFTISGMSLNTYAGTFTFASSDYTAVANTVPDEPEPTSALLMLCGLAGLALRRKRA